ncbi:MAG: 1-acyl-sn-glycerol-3-phosphate acyltransferase [Actinomycetota bacterium]|nr:1-acyl-sn-glycerol-3-phosphate acyltransferase [Actinomycetota bacterium]
MGRFTAVDTPRTVRSRRRSMILRRSVTLPLAVVGFPVLVLLSPLLLALTLIVDLFTTRRRLATTRLQLTVTGYACTTLIVQASALVVWVASGFGLRNWRPVTQRRWRKMTRWWVRTNVAWFARTLGYRTDVEGLERLHSGPLLVFARHESIFDALLPPTLVAADRAMSVRVVLMRELRLEPNLDMVGHRAPHHFVERSGVDPQAEVEAIGRLAGGLPDDAAVIIFPEGRLYRPDVQERVIDRLDETDPVAAERARQLDHLLPPRTGGTLSLLENAPPETDVAFLAHVGFDQLTDPLTVWRSIPLRRPIDVRIFRFDSAEVPDDEQARILWIHERWVEMDAWIEERKAERGETAERRRIAEPGEVTGR